jgi:hypothetical protein
MPTFVPATSRCNERSLQERKIALEKGGKSKGTLLHHQNVARQNWFCANPVKYYVHSYGYGAQELLHIYTWSQIIRYPNYAQHQYDCSTTSSNTIFFSRMHAGLIPNSHQHVIGGGHVPCAASFYYNHQCRLTAYRCWARSPLQRLVAANSARRPKLHRLFGRFHNQDFCDPASAHRT